MSTSPKQADGPFSISNQSAAASGKKRKVRLWSCMGVQQMMRAAGPGVGGLGVGGGVSESGPPDDAQCSSSLHLSVISGEPASECALQAQDWLIY